MITSWDLLGSSVSFCQHIKLKRTLKRKGVLLPLQLPRFMQVLLAIPVQNHTEGTLGNLVTGLFMLQQNNPTHISWTSCIFSFLNYF